MVRKEKLDLEKLIQSTKIHPDKIMKKFWNEINDLLELIEEHKVKKSIESSISNYIIIRLVSTIETFSKNRVREIIDKFQIIPDDILPNNEIIMSISDLQQLKKTRKITEGTIISNKINFQNPKNIDSVFSKLMKKPSLFKEISKRSRAKEFGIRIGRTEYSFEWEDQYELFNLRHSIVHDMITPKLDFEKVRSQTYSTFLFISYIDSIMYDEFRKLVKKSKNISKK